MVNLAGGVTVGADDRAGLSAARGSGVAVDGLHWVCRFRWPGVVYSHTITDLFQVSSGCFYLFLLYDS